MNARYEGFRGAGGRLAEEQLPHLQTHKTSLLGESIWGIHAFDKTHLVVLAEAGLLSRPDAVALLTAMREMEQEGVVAARERAGGGMHSAEHYLIERLGIERGGRINLGRSSGDLIEVARRITIRGHLIELLDELARLREVLLELAGQHAESVMPGYTHGQQAQPSTLGHWALMFDQAFARDSARLGALLERVNRSPAGAAIMTGSDFPIDRARSAALLGFDSPLANTWDAIMSHDLEMEVGAAYAIAASTLGRMADDLFLWVTSEFAFVQLPDRFCGTSSIMPQKKNPDALEAVKSTSSQALGALVSIVTAERGPTGFPILERRHTQDVLWELGRSLRVKLSDMREIVADMQVDTERMAQSAQAHWAQVTDLASALVVETGIDWRRAHRIVGAFVRQAIDGGFTPSTVPLQVLDEAARSVTGEASGLGEDAFARAMSAREFVARREMYGAPSPLAVRREAEAARTVLERDRTAAAAVRSRVDAASASLEAAIDQLIG